MAAQKFTRVKPHTCVICKTVFTPVKFRKEAGKYRPYTGRHACSAQCAYILKGRNKSRDMRANIHKWIGPNNPMWKGACLRRNKAYRGPDWARTAERARKRDGYKCRHCQMSQEEHLARWRRKLEVHHIVPFNQFTNYKKANTASNLVALCTSCHATADRAIEARQLLIPLYDEPPKKAKDGIHRGVKNGRSKLNDNDVRGIRAMLRRGVTYADIAERFNISNSAVWQIKCGQNWSHVA